MGTETATESDPGSGSVLLVVLAAGAGSRFTGSTHKLAAPLRGATVLHHALTNAVDAGLGEVVVITGARRLDELDPHPPPGVVEIHHSGWHHGQATSVQVAVAAARDRGATAIVVGLGDQPGIPPDTWRALAHTDADLAVATYEGRRGNPVRLADTVWAALPTTGDEGARVVMRLRPELVEEVPCWGNPGDIDTQKDLEPWS